jgi:antibiotic biosynthesis monooxygenase (ABM) superfamily enzyme
MTEGAMSLSAPSEPAVSTVTLVTQTRILPGESGSFARWNERVKEVITHFPGFIEQTVIPPAPPDQLDWAILQRFEDAEAARAWLQSGKRQDVLTQIQPALVGSVDVHLFHQREGNEADQASAPVSVMISTEVKPGQDAAFLRWQKRIAAAQARFEGFQGYKIEPPIPGVQDHWLMVVRFDSDTHLERWLTSSQRQKLLAETGSFDARTRIRKLGSGFESWFAPGAGDEESPPPSWKQNAIVLLMLYPFIFLFDALVQRPILQARGMPFWLALFVADVLSVPLLGYVLVPQANRLFSWWLNPAGHVRRAPEWRGTALMVLLYGAMVLLFSRIP